MLEASKAGTKCSPAVSPSPKAKPFNSMTLQVANNIVAEYLKLAGYEYTLSIFLPEAGVAMDKVYIIVW